MRTNTTQWSKTERFVLSATFGFLILSLFAPCGVRASQVIEPSAARIRETLPSELFRALENIERDSSGAVEVQLAGRNGVGVIAQLAVPAVVTPTPAAIAQWAVGHYNDTSAVCNPRNSRNRSRRERSTG
jgi:hypothetical protein